MKSTQNLEMLHNPSSRMTQREVEEGIAEKPNGDAEKDDIEEEHEKDAEEEAKEAAHAPTIRLKEPLKEPEEKEGQKGQCSVKAEKMFEEAIKESWRSRRHAATANTASSLSAFVAIEPESLHNFVQQGEWLKLKIYVDSGATETVVGEDMLNNIKTIEGECARRGVEYEVANGVRIPNLGEKRFKGVTENGFERGLVAQVADVNKALLSVSRMVKSGHRVIFDPAGSYIQDCQSGEQMWLEEEHGMYSLTLWVKEGF